MSIDLLIFDLDGTLVDSETLCAQAFLPLIPELDITADDIVQHCAGWKLAAIIQYLQTMAEREFPAEFERMYRQNVENLFNRNLQSFAGVHDALRAIKIPKCLASSGPTVKIRHSLTLTELLPFFDPNIFSSYEVEIWKPDPGLFLHAAQQMGVHPSRCLVIEDSEVGIVAARTAGMRVLQFCPNAHMPMYAAYFTTYAKLPQILS
jgi:HAD superfamily hydrolase (TIGR01509 family)